MATVNATVDEFAIASIENLVRIATARGEGFDEKTTEVMVTTLKSFAIDITAIWLAVPMIP